MSELEHFDREIYALDERIARLSLICGVDLSRTETVAGLIKGHFETCAHANYVSAHHRDELRALLMMKYKIESSCIDTLGVEDCVRLVSEQSDRLRRSGFPPESLS